LSTSSVNKFIADASLFTAVSLFSHVYSCRYWLIGRLTVNRHVISFFHSPVLRYAVVAFRSVNRCDLYFFNAFCPCILSIYGRLVRFVRLVRCNVSTDPRMGP